MTTWDITKKTETDPGNDIVLAQSTSVEGGVTTTTTHIALVDKLDALRTQIDCNLQVIKGEVPDQEAGVDYFGIILSNTPVSIKVQEISRVIARCDGVRDVIFNRCSLNRRDGRLTFFFTIKSDFGDLEYDKTFENII